MPALPPVRAAPGPPRRGDEGGTGPGGFGCRHTGAVLDDPWSPWSLTFDQRTPGEGAVGFLGNGVKLGVMAGIMFTITRGYMDKMD